MPVISEKVWYRKDLQEKGSVGVFGIYTEAALIVTQDLFDTLKANRANKEWVDHNNTHYAPHQVEQIIELFTLDPEDEIEAGNGDFVQWQEKLINLQAEITSIVVKDEVLLEDAKKIVDTLHDLNRYFNNFESFTERNQKYFRYIKTDVAYSHLYSKASAVRHTIDAYIEESSELTGLNSAYSKRNEEMSSFEMFVKQFEQIQDHTQVTPEMLLQYDTYLGWIQQYFPSVLGQVDILNNKTHFNDLNSIQHTELTNRVTAAYDDLKIAYNTLYPSIKK